MPSYDPDPRRHKRSRSRRGRVPPQLRAWVYRRRKRTHDPGRARSLRRGPRKGHYFQGPTRRRYDPAPRRFERLRSYGRRARGYGSKVESGINRYGSILGFGGALGIGMYTGYQKYVDAFVKNGWNADNPLVIDGIKFTCAWDRYLYVLQHEYQRLYNPTGDKIWTPSAYLKFKFLGQVPEGAGPESSAWVIPFWVSLIGTLAAPIARIFTSKGQRILRPIHKVSVGALAASTIGALALPGCGVSEPQPPPPPNSMNQAKPTYSAPVRTIQYTYQG